MITQERLKALVVYDPETGLMWRNGKRIGARSSGYLVAKLDGKSYRIHRLAWLYVTGTMPNEIDHVNGIKDDNRWVNLRDATRSQNVANTNKRKGYANKSKGAGFHKPSGKWQAYITVNGKQRHLGYFNTEDEAHKRYCDEAERLFGEFHRTK